MIDSLDIGATQSLFHLKTKQKWQDTQVQRLKFQESSSQASSPISANGNSVLDFFIFTKLDQDADQYFHAAETQPSPYLSSDNSLRDSLSCFKLSSDLKNFKSFVFFEACLFQSTNEKSV